MNVGTEDVRDTRKQSIRIFPSVSESWGTSVEKPDSPCCSKITSKHVYGGLLSPKAKVHFLFAPTLHSETEHFLLHARRLLIQVDENEALKRALESTARMKEEDFKLYQETMSQVKEIFLQALRQQKQEKN